MPPAARPSWRLIALLVALRLGVSFLWHPAYGFHRDEFLYFAQGDHLTWLRPTFPPVIGTIAQLSRLVFGESVLAARVPAALAATALTALVLLLARALGARAWGLVLATVAMIAAPVYVRPGVLFHPVVLDQLWCMVAVTGALLAARRDDARWWLVVGLGLGLGAATKFSAAFYAVGLLVATLALPVARAQYRTRWPWLAAAIALLFSLSTVAGQVHYGWPIVAQMRALSEMQLRHVTFAGFASGQLLMLGGGMLVALAGVVAAVREREVTGRLALLFAVTVFALLALMRGKEYYAAPIYPPLIALGAAWLGGRAWLAGTARRAALAGTIALLALALLPIGVPLLAPPAMARYAAALGASGATRTNTGGTLPLPQDYADMLGWEAQAEAMGRAWRRLTPAEQRTALVGASNYGQTGALAFWRRRHGYPYPIGTAGDFWLWGPGDRPGDPALILAPAEARADLETLWGRVVPVDTVRTPLSVPTEQEVVLFRGDSLRQPLAEYWRKTGPNWR